MIDDVLATDEIAAFLDDHFRALAENEEIEIRLIRPHEDKPDDRRQFFSADTAYLADKALHFNKEGYNAYFCPAPRKARLRKGSTDGVTRALSLWIDIDYKDVAALCDDLQLTPQKFARTMIRQGIKALPNYVVESGGGLQAHWFLTEPITDLAHHQSLLRRLALTIGSDIAVAKTPQPMRLPGTHNHKYDPPRLATYVTVAQAPEAYHEAAFANLVREEVPSPAPAFDGPDADLEDLREALRFIPPKPHKDGYDEWTKVLMALHSAFPGPEGLALAQEWDPRKATEIAAKWKGFRADGGYSVGSVFYEAGLRGYQRPLKDPEIVVPKDQPGVSPAPSGVVWLPDFLANPPPPVVWVVGDLLPDTGTSLIVAKAKVGKSFLAMNMGLAVASGQMFLGRETTQGPVIFVSLDMPTGPLFPHIKRLVPAWGIPPRFGFLEDSTDPGLKADPVKRIKEIVALEKPRLLILDTIQHAARIKDPNSYAEVVAALKVFSDLSREHGTHICMIHHARKGGGDGADVILGSTGYHGGVDTVVILEEDEEVGGLKFSISSRWTMPQRPSAIGFDETTRKAFLIDANRDKAAQAACEHMLVAYLAAHPNQRAPERELKAAVPHDPSTVTRALASLSSWARIHKEKDEWALPIHARPRPQDEQLILGAD
jgi:hypothetical protein